MLEMIDVRNMDGSSHFFIYAMSVSILIFFHSYLALNSLSQRLKLVGHAIVITWHSLLEF